MLNLKTRATLVIFIMLLLPALTFADTQIYGDSMGVGLFDMADGAKNNAIWGQHTSLMNITVIPNDIYILNTGTASALHNDKTVIESLKRKLPALKNNLVLIILPTDMPGKQDVNAYLKEVRSGMRLLADENDNLYCIDISHINKEFLDGIHFTKKTNKEIWGFVLDFINKLNQ